MNVRIADHSLRWRVSEAELTRLLTGRALTLKLNLPAARAVQYSVRLSTLGGWRLDSDPTGLWLTLPRAEVELLAQCMPTRAPIEQELPVGDAKLLISFDVDVRTSGSVAPDERQGSSD